MYSATSAPALTRPVAWGGTLISALPVLFLLFDSTIKLIVIRPVVDSFTRLGWPVELAIPIGAIELACIALYLTPRTAVLGGLLLTGYLGGAVATHVRAGSPLLTHTLFPVYVALLLWGGLMLRDSRLRELIPLRR